MRKLIWHIFLTLIIFNFIYAFSGALNYQLESIDVYSIWLLKAKLFFLEGILPLSKVNAYPYAHPHYPILIPIIFAGIYKLVGGINEMYVLLIYPLVYAGILFLVYKVLISLKIKNNLSIILVFLYSHFGPLLAAGGRKHAGEADIFLVLANWMIVYFLLNYYKNLRTKYLVFISIVVAIASQMKLEGILAVLVFLFLNITLPKKLLYMGLALILGVVWQIVVKSIGLKPDFGYSMPSLGELVQRMTLVIYLGLKEIANINNWYMFWPVFIITLIAVKLKKDKFLLTLQKTTLCLVFFYTLNYITNTYNAHDLIISTLDRVLLQISPFWFVIFSLYFAQILNGVRKKLYIFDKII